MKYKKKYKSLGQQIVIRFCLFTALISGIYGLYCFALMYNLEDAFIEREIQTEADQLIKSYQENKKWNAPTHPSMQLHTSRQSLPRDMRQQFIDEPHKNEFYGTQGRHYHLLRLPGFNQHYLVAEVSQMLMVRPMRASLIKALVISGVLLVLIAYVLAWVLARKTVQPLNNLANLVDSVALEQLPNDFAFDYPNNEIGLLARKMEHTMHRINQAVEREKCFTRDASHELRTPLAIIKNAIEVYQVKKSTKEGTEQLLLRISNAATQMEQTVTTLLMLAREEYTSADKPKVQLLPMIEKSVIDHHHLLKNKPVEICIEDNCNVEVSARKGFLKVLLDNLLSNAFQYTESGHVTVSVIDHQLCIHNTGPGIEDSISDQITEPNVKGKQSTGYGFGLSIVKRLCEHQAWQLNVSNDNGTLVSINFGRA